MTGVPLHQLIVSTPILCPYCHTEHAASYKCNARYKAEQEQLAIASPNKAPELSPNRKKRYRASNKGRKVHREYMRGYMRKKRLGAPST